jgi:hypothetical protein
MNWRLWACSPELGNDLPAIAEWQHYIENDEIEAEAFGQM